MKKVHTTVSTGDTFTINNLEHTVGTQKRIDGQLLINLSIRINATSGYSIQVSTQKLNKMLTTALIKNKAI